LGHQFSSTRKKVSFIPVKTSGAAIVFQAQKIFDRNFKIGILDPVMEWKNWKK
jgi:hypothetical protein